MFNEDNCVGSSQTETKPSDMGCEEKEVNGWVSVEPEKRVKVAEAVLIMPSAGWVWLGRKPCKYIRTYSTCDQMHIILCLFFTSSTK